jgi:hypothetical protein
MEEGYYTGGSLYNGLKYSYSKRSTTVLFTFKNVYYYRNFSSIPLALQPSKRTNNT